MKEGYIIDYISGLEVKATPEEVDAVQIFAKILVEDYGYSKDVIITHPQYRVKVRPSDEKKEYPVEDYLRFSKAQLGVWFNGEERFFIRKYEKDGKVLFNEIPNIPKFGQRIEDIGMFKRADLKPTHNLKATFKAIRNHLAANTVGATRVEVLAQQLINLIFCKIYDERFTEPSEIVTFRAGVDEDAAEIQKRILELFEKVKRKYKEVMDVNDSITLDTKLIVYVVGELQNYCLNPVITRA